MRENCSVCVTAVFMDSDGVGSLHARRPIELSNEDFGVLPTRVVGLTTPRFGSWRWGSGLDHGKAVPDKEALGNLKGRRMGLEGRHVAES
jgi:hypothetical protein